MERTPIKINLEGGSAFELQSPSQEVSNDLFTLSQEGYSSRIPTLGFEFCIPAFGKDHMLVEMPGRDVGLQGVVVYGVRCGQETRMTKEEVANRVRDVFGVDVVDSITSMNSPDGMAVEDGEAYPCGTLFTAGVYSRSSESFSPPLSPVPRPQRLPLNNSDSHLTTPHSVATPNTTFPNYALVAGMGSYNVPCDEAIEDSAPASECVRKVTMETVQTQVHQTLAPVHKDQQQHHGGTVDMGVIILETPSKNVTQLTIRDLDDAPLDFQPSSQESEPRLHSLQEQEGPASSTDSKSHGNQLVVGIGNPRTITSSLKPAPAFGRQLSLPEEKTDKLSPIHRNASDVCLNEKTSVRRRRSLCDMTPNLEIVAHEQTVEELPDKTPDTPIKEAAATPTKDTLTTPTKLVAIERQESVEEKNEFVMPWPTHQHYYLPQNNIHVAERTVLLKVDEHPQEASAHSDENYDPLKEGEAPVSSDPLFGGEAPVSSDPLVEGEAPVSSDPLFGGEAPVSSDPLFGGEAPVSSEDSGDLDPCESIGINFQATPTGSSDSPDYMYQSPQWQQVHLLEHAMNGYCFRKDVCTFGGQGNLEFVQAVEQMKAMVEEARNGIQDEDLKSYIRLHCEKCRDKDCKVPHLMAGCSPPGQSFSSSESEQTDSPPRSSSPYQESPVTFDLEAANQSSTSDVERYHAQASPIPPLTFVQPASDAFEAVDMASHNQTAPFSPQLQQRSQSPYREVPVATSYLNSPVMMKHFPSERQCSGANSPLGSTGFLLPGVNHLVKGRHHQESQLGAASYIQQASDQGQSVLRPQFQYIEPSKSGSGLRKMYGVGDNRRKEVKAGEFPSYNTLPRKPGTLVYADEAHRNDLIPGEVYPCPQSVPDRDKLGKGGNGTVVKFPLGGTEYALKLTQYRESELNTWSKLQHRNIVPLLGVMMADQPRFCYQFMPRMTGDLRSMMIDRGDLLTHLKSHPKEWDLVRGNTLYILGEISSGLCYLHSKNIQHSDLKAHNILILKRCTCPDILHCVCTGDNKYEVRIADFDSLKKTKFSRTVAQFPELCRIPMNDMDMNGVKGTPAYRAPEQFKKCSSRTDFKRVVEDGKDSYDMEGPWCDMWSLGVIVLQMILGSHNKGSYIFEASILTSCKDDKMGPRVEPTVATLRRSQLHYLAAHSHPELRPLALIAEECLKVDFRKRATAEAVLKTLQDQQQTL